MAKRMKNENPFRAILAVLLAFVLTAFVTIGSVPVAVFAADMDADVNEDTSDDTKDADGEMPDDNGDTDDEEGSDNSGDVNEENPGDNEDADTLNDGDGTGKENDADLLIERIGDLDPLLDEEDGTEEDGKAESQDTEDGAGTDAAENDDKAMNISEILGMGDDSGEMSDEDADLDDTDDGDSDSDDDFDTETVTVRMQTEHDFADRDEFGVWRDADGNVSTNEFKRYVGVSEDGVLLFTANEDGDITYEDEKRLYLDTEKNAFFSDTDRTVPLAGLRGLLASAELEADADTMLAVLEGEDTAIAVTLSGEDVYPKLLIDRQTGRQLTKAEAAEQGISADRIEERDPEDQTYLIWKATEKDEDYAPEFASYICADMDGGILFFADSDGYIYRDISEHALYNEDYFYTFAGIDGQGGEDGRLITRYGDLGLSHYPAAGETVRFTVDGEAFEMEMLDRGEGARGRYLCRRITDEVTEDDFEEDEAEDADDDWESDEDIDDEWDLDEDEDIDDEWETDESEDIDAETDDADDIDDWEDDADDDDDFADTDDDDDGEYSWDPEELLEDETVVLVMDANGNIYYAADDFEWQFVDFGLDYEQLARMVAAGRDIDVENTIDDPEDAILAGEAEIEPEEEEEEPDENSADDPLADSTDEEEDDYEEEDEDDEDDEDEEEERWNEYSEEVSQEEEEQPEEEKQPEEEYPQDDYDDTESESEEDTAEDDVTEEEELVDEEPEEDDASDTGSEESTSDE